MTAAERKASTGMSGANSLLKVLTLENAATTHQY